MATNGNFNGTLVSLYVDVSGTMKKVAHALGTSLDLKTDILETSNKSGSGWETSIVGLKRGTIAVDGHFAFDVPSGEYQHSLIYDAWVAGTALTVKVGTGITGDIKFTQSAYFESFQLEAPFNDLVTFSGNLRITGAITKGTES